jgi:hypothetical protein
MNTNIVTKENASNLRKYFIEYTVLFLTACVVVLFYMYTNVINRVMELQTTVIERNTQSNIETKAELINLKNSSK